MSGIYDLTLAPGQNERLLVVGTRFRVTAAPFGLVKIRPNTGDAFMLLEGQGAHMPDGSSFSQVNVTNMAAVAQTISVFVGDSMFEDGRITGSVYVVDGEKNKVLAGVAFRAQGSQVGGVSNAQVQLMNPAGSAKNVFVNALRAGASAADSWLLIRSTTQLPTALTSGANVDSTGPGSAVTVRSDNTGTAHSGLTGFGQGYVQGSQDLVIVFPRPLILRPGQGATFSTSAGATNIRTTWEWEEWPL